MPAFNWTANPRQPSARRGQAPAHRSQSHRPSSTEATESFHHPRDDPSRRSLDLVALSSKSLSVACGARNSAGPTQSREIAHSEMSRHAVQDDWPRNAERRETHRQSPRGSDGTIRYPEDHSGDSLLQIPRDSLLDTDVAGLGLPKSPLLSLFPLQEYTADAEAHARQGFSRASEEDSRASPWLGSSLSMSGAGASRLSASGMSSLGLLLQPQTKRTDPLPSFSAGDNPSTPLLTAPAWLRQPSRLQTPLHSDLEMDSRATTSTCGYSLEPRGHSFEPRGHSHSLNHLGSSGSNSGAPFALQQKLQVSLPQASQQRYRLPLTSVPYSSAHLPAPVAPILIAAGPRHGAYTIACSP